MAIYIFLLIYILFFEIIYQKMKNNFSRKIYILFVGFILLFLMGARHSSMGNYDTENIYLPAFSNIKNLSFFKVIEIYKKDVLFYILTKVFTLFFTNEQLWLTFVSFPFIFMVCRLIYKYSKNIYLSFIVFLALNYYGMNFTLLRHSIALAFVLYSYDFLRTKKIKMFVLTVCIASLFHSTSLIFLLAYPISKLKFDFKQVLVLCVAFLMTQLFGNEIFRLIFNFIKIERYQAYINRGITIDLMPFFINTFFLLTNIYIYQNSKKKDTEIELLLNLSTINCALLSCTTIIGESYRLAMFYGIFNIILLPNSIKLLSKKETRVILLYGIYIVLILYFLFCSLENAMILPYKFYWN